MNNYAGIHNTLHTVLPNLYMNETYSPLHLKIVSVSPDQSHSGIVTNHSESGRQQASVKGWYLSWLGKESSRELKFCLPKSTG